MASIKTRILVISDTHGDDLIHKPITGTYDVAIHCGDLTDEFSNTDLLRTETTTHGISSRTLTLSSRTRHPTAF